MTLPAEMYSFGSSITMLVVVQVAVTTVINFIFIPIFYNNHIDNCNAVSISIVDYVYTGLDINVLTSVSFAS